MKNAVYRTLGPFALFAAVSCGGAQSAQPHTEPTARPEALLTLGGELVYPTPLSRASAEVQAFWQSSQALLRDRIPAVASDTPEEDYGRVLGQTLRPWLQGHMDGLRSLAEQTHGLMVEGHAPEVGVLVGATFGFVVDDMIAQIDAVPSPEHIRNDPELEAAFRQRLRALTVNIAELGGHAYEACAGERDRAPEAVRGWAARCEARAAAIAARVSETRAAENAPADDGAPAMPPECEGGEWTAHVRDWDGPAPDEHLPREVALVLSTDRIPAAARERVLTAVTARLRRVRGLRLVSRADVRAAEQLVAERRIAAGGPVCGRPWPLTALIAQRHHNLVLGTAEGFCGREAREGEEPQNASGPEHCSLSVTFHRVGTDDDSNLPAYLTADVADGNDANAWVRAAGALASPAETSGSGGILGALSGNGDRVEYRVLGYADDEPALRIGDVLYDWLHEDNLRARMAACSPGRGVGSYAIRWTVSPTGEVTESTAEPITRLPEGDPDAVARCIATELRRVAWPCTPSGQPVRVEARMCLGR